MGSMVTAASLARPEEKVLFASRPHPLALLAPSLAALAAIAIALAAVPVFGWAAGASGLPASVVAGASPAVRLAAYGLAGLGLLLFLSRLAEYLSTSFAVTDRRVIARSGVIRVRVTATYLAKVEAVLCAQGPLERHFDCGTVALAGGGHAQDVICHVPKFRSFTQLVGDAIEAPPPERRAA